MNDRMMTPRQLADYLNVSLCWIYGHTWANAKEQIPHVKVGKYLRFRQAAVDAWLVERGKETLVATPKDGLHPVEDKGVLPHALPTKGRSNGQGDQAGNGTVST